MALAMLFIVACNGRNSVVGDSEAIDSAATEATADAQSDSVLLSEDIILDEIQWHLDHGNYQEAEQWRSLLPQHRQEQIVVDKKEAPSESGSAPTKKAKSSSTPAKKAAATSQGGKTIYISTYGANGKVWGHVRMNGNTGRGTIHDDDENTLTITVTRHGNELFGTDQNGRQYVFKL